MKVVIEIGAWGGGIGIFVERIWFRWSEFTQKRAQSIGNHIERLWEKNLNQKIDLTQKLEQFSENKVGFVKDSYVKWHITFT